MPKKKVRKKKIYFSFSRIICFVVLLVIFCGGGLLFKSPLENVLNGTFFGSKDFGEVGITVHYIDVGQGDCILIELPNNQTFLIDAGPGSEKEQMLAYLNENVFNDKDKVIDYLMLTHSDEDHCGGMPIIFNNFEVKKVFRPQIYIDETDKARDSTVSAEDTVWIKNTIIYTNTINAFYNETYMENGIEKNCDVEFVTPDKVLNESLNFGTTEYSFKFFTPLSTYYQAVNDYSPIMLLSSFSKNLLFTGDASTINENQLLDSVDNNLYTLPKIDVLKVGHHGSKTSSGLEFLQLIQPKYAVIQVGEGNSYNHPTPETINRLESLNCQIYRTDLDGNIVCEISKTGNLSFGNFVAEKNVEYIKIEYVISALTIISVYFCFFVKYKSNQFI